LLNKKIKKMDTSSLVLGTFFLTIFMVPLLFVVFNQSKDRKKHLKQLNKTASKNNLNLDETEVTFWATLGFDKTSKTLVFGDNQRKCDLDVIAVKELKDVQLTTLEHTKNKIKYVAIKLIWNSRVKEIVFYNEKADTTADALVGLHLAKKWLGYIQKT